LRGWLSPAWPAHAAQVIPDQSQVVQFIMFAFLYFVGQAKTSSCLCSITQPGQSTKALANMWANSLQPAKLRPGQSCSRDTTFSVVSPGPGRGALFGCRGAGSLASQRRKHGKLHAASAAGPQSRPRERALGDHQEPQVRQDKIKCWTETMCEENYSTIIHSTVL
jgi:hypothetical protein